MIWDRGRYELEDPDRDGYLNGVEINKHQTGHCGLIKWRLIKSIPDDKFREVVNHLIEMCREIVQEARGRPKENVGGVYVHRGRGRSSCKSGRHRATTMADLAAKVLREWGCTVKIHHLSLWRGVIYEDRRRGIDFDDRGPCGCELGPDHCGLVQRWRTAQRAEFNRAHAEGLRYVADRFRHFSRPRMSSIASNLGIDGHDARDPVRSLPLPKAMPKPASVVPKALPAVAKASQGAQLDLGVSNFPELAKAASAEARPPPKKLPKLPPPPKQAKFTGRLTDWAGPKTVTGSAPANTATPTRKGMERINALHLEPTATQSPKASSSSQSSDSSTAGPSAVSVSSGTHELDSAAQALLNSVVSKLELISEDMRKRTNNPCGMGTKEEFRNVLLTKQCPCAD